MSEEGTFVQVTKQSFTFQNKHNLSEMILMLLLVLRINQDIIEVNNDKRAIMRPKHMIH